MVQHGRGVVLSSLGQAGLDERLSGKIARLADERSRTSACFRVPKEICRFLIVTGKVGSFRQSVLRNTCTV